MCSGGEDVLLYLVTVDNLGQIVCTSCIQTAANRVICLVSQHWNGFESFFFNWSCSTKAPVHLYQYEQWAIFERIICVLHTNDSKKSDAPNPGMDLKVFVKKTFLRYEWSTINSAQLNLTPLSLLPKKWYFLSNGCHSRCEPCFISRLAGMNGP